MLGSTPELSFSVWIGNIIMLLFNIDDSGFVKSTQVEVNMVGREEKKKLIW